MCCVCTVLFVQQRISLSVCMSVCECDMFTLTFHKMFKIPKREGREKKTYEKDREKLSIYFIFFLSIVRNGSVEFVCGFFIITMIICSASFFKAYFMYSCWTIDTLFASFILLYINVPQPKKNCWIFGSCADNVFYYTRCMCTGRIISNES